MEVEIAVIILAAGLGKRMRSPKAKVLHEILGRPMLSYVIDVAREIAGGNVILVVGNQAEAVRRAVSGETVRYATQERQLGTGHAVRCALPQLPDDCEQVVVLCGDTPLLTAPTLKGLVYDHLTARRDATLLAVELDDPQGYGRLLLNDHHQVCGIVEEADASAGQRAIRLINTGIYCVTRQFLSQPCRTSHRTTPRGSFISPTSSGSVTNRAGTSAFPTARLPGRSWESTPPKIWPASRPSWPAGTRLFLDFARY
ncbi:MAG: nucleoside-diphosphate-sugar pyrophosphorylase [Syntrophobacterales bacterium]|nr:MAG: nucleoside-diphosphate-sugar pyrophosphorylase [Syntrophobacterales bacterium]